MEQNQQPQPAVAGVPVQVAGNALQSTQFISGQFHGGSRLLSEQLFAAATPRPASTSFFPASPSVQTQSFGFSNSHSIFKRSHAAPEKDTKTKRDLVQLSNGQTIDDSLLGNADEIEGLTFFGGNDFKEFLVKQHGGGADLEDEIKEYDREPAEGEVMAIMNLCSFCDHEPFQGALILTWRKVRITMHHALQAKAQGTCGQF